MNINARHYVVFGATGNTGQELVPLLLKAGHSVRAFVRSPAKVRFTHQRLEVIKGDITDTMDVRNAIKGTDGVISLVGGLYMINHTKGACCCLLLRPSIGACKNIRSSNYYCKVGLLL